MAQPLLELTRASRIYGKGATAVHAMREVDLAISPGEFTTIVGASGSGKSTCLNILGCLDLPSLGTFRLAGRSVATLSVEERALLRREYIGFVLQSPNLLARLTALQNVELPLVYRGVGKEERRGRAAQALAAVGLANRAKHFPDELSGGQQQRVAIARAIVSSPRILIADEPTGALDSKTGAGILDLLSELNRSQGLTIVMVTHDGSIADRAGRLCVFRDGRLVSDRVRGQPIYAD